MALAESSPHPYAIRTVAVIGAGEQGRAFALRCARAGFATVLEDVMPAKLRKAGQQLAELGESRVAGSLSFASTVEDAVREADLAIDFVPDELESKLEIVCLLDRMAPPKTIFCVPTRALSITDLAACTYRADRCVGIDWTGSDDGAAAWRVIQGRAASERAVDAVRQWLQALGGVVEVVSDTLA